MGTPFRVPDPADRAPDAPDWLVGLLRDLGGRAAGVWACEPDRLRLEAFTVADGLSTDVAQGFAQATRHVLLDQRGLGIVGAAVERMVVTSWAAELPDDGGSGTWLRAFNAARSVAVPLLDAQGQTRRVIAIALGPECALGSDDVAHRLRAVIPKG